MLNTSARTPVRRLMKTQLCAILGSFTLLASVTADVSTIDLKSPKPDPTRPMRILLHVPGSPRLIDFCDVCKILCAEPGQISFETSDGFVVTHQGTFTLIQQRSTVPDVQIERPGPQPGTRYFDPK